MAERCRAAEHCGQVASESRAPGDRDEQQPAAAEEFGTCSRPEYRAENGAAPPEPRRGERLRDPRNPSLVILNVILGFD